MSKLQQRLNLLEKKSREQLFSPPNIIEIWVTHEDGTKELKERRVNGVVVFPAPDTPPYNRINELIDLAHERKAEAMK